MSDELNNPNWDNERHEEEFWGVPAGSSASELREGSTDKPAFDLEERTALFGEAIIRFAKKIPFNPVNNRLIDQLVGAGTSVGANYCEANDGVSRKDFKHKIGTCRKEAKETRFFLRMIATAEPNLKPEARVFVAGSARTEPDFQRHLAQMKSEIRMTNLETISNEHPLFEFRISLFGFPVSSFVIRHSNLFQC
jgi:four helix bundle protein